MRERATTGTTVPSGRWGLPDVWGGILAGVVISTIAYGIVLAIGGWDPEESMADGAAVGRTSAQVAAGGDIGTDAVPFVGSTLLVVPLWAGLLGAIAVAGRRGFTREDLRWGGRPSDVLVGVPIGIVTQLVAVPLLYLPLTLLVDDLDVSEQARRLTDRASGVGVLVLVLVVVVGAPVVEELFYRGLALAAFERRMSPMPALAASSVLFGAVHLQLLQFPALVMFGAVAGLIAQRSGRILLPIAAHVGFNATTVVVLLGTS